MCLFVKKRIWYGPFVDHFLTNDDANQWSSFVPRVNFLSIHEEYYNRIANDLKHPSGKMRSGTSINSIFGESSCALSVPYKN